jgi:hypothetical protein
MKHRIDVRTRRTPRPWRDAVLRSSLLVLSVSQSLGWPVALRASGEKGPSLQLRIYKQQYVVGEPVIATLRLGSETLHTPPEFFDSRDFGTRSDFHFIFSSLAEQVVGKVSLSGSGGSPVFQRPPLRPGEFWQCEEMFVPRGEAGIEGRARKPLGPGEYILTAKVPWCVPAMIDGRLQYPPVRLIESNPVQLTVMEPTGADADALRLMLSHGIRGFLEGGGGPPPIIETVLERHPNCTYAPYARVRMLLDRVPWFRNHRRSGVSGAEREEAERLVGEALQYAAMPDFRPLADNILLSRARLQQVLRDPLGAARTLKLVVTEFPHSDAAETAARLLEGMPPAVRDVEPASLPERTRRQRWLVPGVIAGGLLALGLILYVLRRD